MIYTATKSIVKIATVTRTLTEGEFEMDEIQTPTDDYGNTFESITAFQQYIHGAGLAEKIEPVELSIHNERGQCFKYTDARGGTCLECAWVEEEKLPEDIYLADFECKFGDDRHEGDWRDMLDISHGDYRNLEINAEGITANHIRTGKELWPRNPGESDYEMVSRIFRSADEAHDLWVKAESGVVVSL